MTMNTWAGHSDIKAKLVVHHIMLKGYHCALFTGTVEDSIVWFRVQSMRNVGAQYHQKKLNSNYLC